MVVRAVSLTLSRQKVKTPKQQADIVNYKNQATRKKIDASLQEGLLNKVRAGDAASIPQLVDSCEHLIVRVIVSELDDRSISVEKLFDAGTMALTTLAKRELHSTGRDRFFRFRAWWVRQAILEELADRS